MNICRRHPRRQIFLGKFFPYISICQKRAFVSAIIQVKAISDARDILRGAPGQGCAGLDHFYNHQQCYGQAASRGTRRFAKPHPTLTFFEEKTRLRSR